MKVNDGYLEQTLNKQASVVLEGRVGPAEARALPLRGGEEEAEGPHNLRTNKSRDSTLHAQLSQFLENSSCSVMKTVYRIFLIKWSKRALQLGCSKLISQQSRWIQRAQRIKCLSVSICILVSLLEVDSFTVSKTSI